MTRSLLVRWTRDKPAAHALLAAVQAHQGPAVTIAPRADPHEPSWVVTLPGRTCWRWGGAPTARWIELVPGRRALWVVTRLQDRAVNDQAKALAAHLAERFSGQVEG